MMAERFKDTPVMLFDFGKAAGSKLGIEIPGFTVFYFVLLSL